MSATHAIAQLRHLYAQMIEGHVRDTGAAARGLLGPAIAELERFMDARASPAPETRTAAPFCGYCRHRHAAGIRCREGGCECLGMDAAPETRTGEGAETPIVRSDWRCEAGTEACPGTQGSLAKEWICVACGRKAHAPKTWRDKGLAAKPPTYEPSGSEKDGEGPRSPSPREGTP